VAILWDPDTWQEAIMFRYPIIIGLLVALAMSAGIARAAVFCVGTVDAFQHALSVASTNSQDNTIKVRTGTYLSPDHGFTYWRASGPAKLVIEGGWSAGCTTQTQDASLTVIDGGDEHPLLNLYAFDPHARDDIFVRYFDLYDGISETDVSPIDIETDIGDARVENCRIRYNFALSPDIEIARLASYDGGDVYFLDNVVADNTARDSPQLMYFASDTHSFVNNNTITANLFGTSADYVNGLILSNHGVFANNILWDNTGAYPEIWSGIAPVLVDNDVDFIDAMDPSSHGNINADPRFVSRTNRRLNTNSPACDVGDNTPPGSTRTIDLDGNPRIVRRVDMGAYERQGSCR
jgi:hypothetical protein